MSESGGDSDTEETHFQHTGGANPVSLRQAAPSRGRGENVGRFECIDPSFLWKEVPAGRRLGAQSGMKEDDADGKTFLHKSLLTRVPYPPLRGPPSQWGRLRGATLRVNFYKGRYPKAACKSLMHTDHADGSDDERHPEKLKGSEVLPEDGKGEKNG